MAKAHQPVHPEAGDPPARFTLPELAYGYDRLAPHMSESTLRTHHGKHHATYLAKLNAMLTDRGGRLGSLEAIIQDAAHDGVTGLFNNAAQVWNHSFFWESMSAVPSRPSGALETAIGRDFASLEALRAAFVAEATGHFASGWVWLTRCGSRLAICSTHDAATVITDPDQLPLLVCDLWEHAYYLDYRQDRAAFVGAWWDHLANWTFAERQFIALDGHGAAWHHPPAA